MLKKTALAVLISGFAIASFAADAPAAPAKPAAPAATEHKAAPTGKHKHAHHKKSEAKAETPAAPAK